MRYEVRIQLKPDVLNVESKEILSAVHNAGFASVVKLDTAKIFIIDIPTSSDSDSIIEKIAEEILSNNVIENYSIKKIDV